VEHALITVTLETSPEEASSGPSIQVSILQTSHTTFICSIPPLHNESVPSCVFKIKALSNQMTDNPKFAYFLGLVVILIEANTGHYHYNDLHFF
jgi:hypothetical protein